MASEVIRQDAGVKRMVHQTDAPILDPIATRIPCHGKEQLVATRLGELLSPGYHIDRFKIAQMP